MKVIERSEEFTPEVAYKLTMSPEIGKMKDQENSTIEVAKWCIFTDVDNDGKENTIFSIMTPEGEVFASNSKTFREAYFSTLTAMKENFNVDMKMIKVVGGTTKVGRPFITCAYAG